MLALHDGATWSARPARGGPEIWLVTEGAAALSWEKGSLALGRGDAIFVAPGVGAYAIQAAGPPVRLFRAAVP